MSSPERWQKVDDYVADLFGLKSPQLQSTLSRSREHVLPEIQVSFPLGQLLFVLTRAMAARRVLEIGTLGGFSTTFLARALPADGVLYSMELEPKHAEVARENLSDAGLAAVVHVVEGDAKASLTRMIAAGTEPFDLVFIDADKTGYPAYIEAVLELSRQGTLIIADNIVRDGAVVDADSDDEDVQGVRAFNAVVAAHPRLDGTIIQTVGAKGYDGIAVVVVTE